MFSISISQSVNMSWDPLFPSLPLVLGTIISGILLHILVYRHNKWDSKAPYLVFSYLSTALAGSLFARISSIAVLGSCHLAGLFGSILAYRVFYHPLKAFPGPFMARISNLLVTYLSTKNLRLYEETQRLHEKYRDYVRLSKFALSY